MGVLPKYTLTYMQVNEHTALPVCKYNLTTTKLNCSYCEFVLD